MKAKMLVEIEVEIKDKVSTMKRQDSSDRGLDFVEVITTPTQSDVEKMITNGINLLHSNAKDDRFTPFVILGSSIKETTLIPQ